ncbi:MAG: cyclic lactone autoinducer peptide [Clostridia bacterium]|nr:cyclic lactone autoinducer peptide [Clostridia bacterium]
MKKILKRMVEKYAKSSTSSCFCLFLHQPKAPKCLIDK